MRSISEEAIFKGASGNDPAQAETVTNGVALLAGTKHRNVVLLPFHLAAGNGVVELSGVGTDSCSYRMVGLARAWNESSQGQRPTSSTDLPSTWQVVCTSLRGAALRLQAHTPYYH